MIIIAKIIANIDEQLFFCSINGLNSALEESQLSCDCILARKRAGAAHDGPDLQAEGCSENIGRRPYGHRRRLFAAAAISPGRGDEQTNGFRNSSII